MIEGIQHELILLPASARQQIPECLQKAGIEVAPPQKTLPAKFKDAGTVFTCKEGSGTADILVMDEAQMPPEHRSMVPVLIFPGRGALSDWLHGTTDRALRGKIHQVLYAFKTEITTQSDGPANGRQPIRSE